MKVTTLAALLMCASIFTVEASEKKILTKKNSRTMPIATKRNSQNFDPQTCLNIKDKKQQTEERNKEREYTENFKEKGEDHFFYRD